MLFEKILTGHMQIEYEKYSWTLGPCQLDIHETCDTDNIQFYLYTREKKEPELIRIRDEKPPRSFDPTASTKLLIHGYAGSLEFNGTSLVRQAYLETGKYNIIVVDWGKLVRLPCYPTAVLNTWHAGKCTGQLLEKLARFKMKGFRLSRLHIIGFSLGAHVAAYASNYIQASLKKKIERITGLDPALPFFASLKSSWKLDRYDAGFVDIIHTNSGIFGKIEATGHADFYVNGGVSQPACKKAHNPPLCSHVIATVYFAESILAEGNQVMKKFWALSCHSFLDVFLGRCKEEERQVLMGDSCSKKIRGIFYVGTKNAAPFANG